MLEFNPHKRPQLSQILSDKCFDSVRSSAREQDAPRKIDFESLDDDNISMEFFKEAIVSEVSKIKHLYKSD